MSEVLEHLIEIGVVKRHVLYPNDAGFYFISYFFHRRQDFAGLHHLTEEKAIELGLKWPIKKK